ncbi:MAG: hypothetical protein OHK0044_30450 [Burkholderiaceae bacterium]
MSRGGDERLRITFTYWGRRGFGRFALDIARAATADESLDATFSVSRQNEAFAEFEALGDAVVAVDTFSSAPDALLGAGRVFSIRRTLRRHVARHRTQAVVELMPHVWSPLVMPAVSSAGVAYLTTVHDALTHPGDHRSHAAAWLLRRATQQADGILTLSHQVAAQIKKRGLDRKERVFELFLPDLGVASRRRAEPPSEGRPWRLLFLGRILSYKGLPLFLDMVDELRRRGIGVEIGVYGEGDLGACETRLARLGAEVVNRWLTEQEIETALGRFHAVVLSHTEASQSGVAAAAFGAAVPVIATPVGGLVEQIEDGVTGILAARTDAASLADAVTRLLRDPDHYQRICRNLVETRPDRSAARFVQLCAQAVRSVLSSRPTRRR